MKLTDLHARLCDKLPVGKRISLTQLTQKTTTIDTFTRKKALLELETLGIVSVESVRPPLGRPTVFVTKVRDPLPSERKSYEAPAQKIEWHGGIMSTGLEGGVMLTPLGVGCVMEMEDGSWLVRWAETEETAPTFEQAKSLCEYHYRQLLPTGIPNSSSLSPVKAFLREACRWAPNDRGARTTVDDLYAAWRLWCVKDANFAPGTRQTFGRELSAALPGLKRSRDTCGTPFYRGIELLNAKQELFAKHLL